MAKQIIKRIMKDYVPTIVSMVEKEQVKVVKKSKKEETMTNEQIERAEVLAQGIAQGPEVKVVKKDKGLIERVNSEKVILTEDNRQVLTD